MKIFIDTSIFFNLVEGNKREQEKIRTLLKHAKHVGYTLTTSITVYGEIVQVCFRDKRKELYTIFNFVKDLDITCWLPNKQLRICCSCLDKIDPEDRVGLSIDHVHDHGRGIHVNPAIAIIRMIIDITAYADRVISCLIQGAIPIIVIMP